MSEREQFEAWARRNKHDVSLFLANPEIYDCNYTQVLWEGWQASRAQPATTPETAQAVPLLSVMEAIRIGAKHSTGLNHTREFTEEGFLACVAEIEQAVRAKLGAGAPMMDRVHKANGGAAVHPALLSTDEWFEFWENCDNVDGESVFPEFLCLAQDVEQLVLAKVGIVGKEGA